ncbi:MAG: bifunctional folylpolyglutamate synthase/dihydrofolate synthase [Candidatus Tokpelaia sp.]|nr:MAG: bifunctional folylpolyglutamate synthase/dihydrofolate synthase [Candidatus Tokpelaia sp.]KAA6206228.1 MAG: bifunctional folylpolyglutamate synthase/dihydrofolate synthase [Candidatus Tokpelaia sp.]
MAAKNTGLQQKIESLLNLHPKNVDLSLKRMTRLLQKLGNPHLHLPPIIHIAGTNGKGSAASFARAALEAAGYSVHVHISPHLVHWHERYRLGWKDGTGSRSAYVSDALLAETLAEVTQANAGGAITVFEIITAAAFVLFARFPADALVLEVGLGGRFDATNIIKKPAVSLIMSIALDHEAFLGDTVAQIALEKAGIIKKQCPVVAGPQIYEEVITVLRRFAQKNQAPLTLYGQDYRADIKNRHMLFTNKAGTMRLPRPRLAGDFQIGNAAAALQAVLTAGFAVSPQAAAQAMRTVSWPARLQKLTTGRLKRQAPPKADLWLDGGHNPAAAQLLVKSLAPLLRRRPFFMILAMLQTKDSTQYLQQFATLAPQIYTVPLAGSNHGVPPAVLAQKAQALGLRAQVEPSITAALAAITAKSAKPGGEQNPAFILICGSLYLAGEALAQNGTPPR